MACDIAHRRALGSPGAHLEPHPDHAALLQRLRQLFEETEAGQRAGQQSDTREAARAVVAQFEGRVLFAKLYNDTGRLGALWANCLALLGARAPWEALSGV